MIRCGMLCMGFSNPLRVSLDMLFYLEPLAAWRCIAITVGPFPRRLLHLRLDFSLPHYCTLHPSQCMMRVAELESLSQLR